MNSAFNTWAHDKFFREAEGEGGGGADGGAPSEGAHSAPDTLSALQDRLDRLSKSMDSITRETKQRTTISAITERDTALVADKQKAQEAVLAAQEKLASAYDNGEGREIAQAQTTLTEAIAKRERADMAVEDFRARVKEAEKRQSSGGDLDDTNLTKWKNKHSGWYGVDAAMTKASHEIDRQIREAGVLSVGSEAYFQAVDRQMQQRYPDKFGGTPPSGGSSSSGDGSQRSSSTSGRIQQSIADGWRRMGINVSDPETLKRMIRHRETAVQKGILSATPATGSVITR